MKAKLISKKIGVVMQGSIEEVMESIDKWLVDSDLKNKYGEVKFEIEYHGEEEEELDHTENFVD